MQMSTSDTAANQCHRSCTTTSNVEIADATCEAASHNVRAQRRDSRHLYTLACKPFVLSTLLLKVDSPLPPQLVCSFPASAVCPTFTSVQFSDRACDPSLQLLLCEASRCTACWRAGVRQELPSRSSRSVQGCSRAVGRSERRRKLHSCTQFDTTSCASLPAVSGAIFAACLACDPAQLGPCSTASMFDRTSAAARPWSHVGQLRQYDVCAWRITDM